MFDNPNHFLFSQMRFIGIGFIFFFLATQFSIEKLRSLTLPLVLLATLLCFFTFLPFVGKELNGAKRWFGFGNVMFQPSEILKIIIPLFVANLIDKRSDEIRVFSRVAVPCVIVTTLLCGIVILQNDFSTALFLFCLTLLMLFIAGVPVSFFVGMLLVMVPIVFLVIFSKEHRVLRLLSFVIPDFDPSGASYQAEASLRAIGSGGFFGKGLGMGIRKISSIPMVQSDFVFSAWVEEMGFLGVALYFVVLGGFAWRGYIISIKGENLFNRLFVFGLISAIVFQSLMNLGVVVKAFPVTGITLPFFSAGGSSCLISMMACGFVINASHSK